MYLFRMHPRVGSQHSLCLQWHSYQFAEFFDRAPGGEHPEKAARFRDSRASIEGFHGALLFELHFVRPVVDPNYAELFQDGPANQSGNSCGHVF